MYSTRWPCALGLHSSGQHRIHAYDTNCYVGLQLTTSEAGKRLQWVKDMRKMLSPPEMIKADGSVNQDFFKPKKVQLCHHIRCLRQRLTAT